MFEQSSNMKYLLKESYSTMKKAGFNVVKDLPTIMENSTYFNTYIESLAEGLSESAKAEFMLLSENVRQAMITESYITNYVPYQSLVFPIMRMYFPRLVAREAVTVKPMDKPEMVLAFLKAVAKVGGDKIDLPAVDRRVTYLPLTANITFTSDTVTHNLKDDINDVFEPTGNAPVIERRVILNSWSDGTNVVSQEVVVNTNDGSFTTTIDFGNNSVELVHGRVDFNTGFIYAARQNGICTSFQVSFLVSMESNLNTPEVEIKIERIPLTATRRSLRVRWTPDFEQDIKALFDLDVQAELVNWISQQIAIEIDAGIIADLNMYCNATNRNQITFYKQKPVGFAFGIKEWYSQIVIKINEAASKIYTDTHIAEGNVVLANPTDAQMIQALDTYSAEGFYSGDMAINISGLQVGTLNGKYRVLSSAIVPAGSMFVILKSADERASTYVYAPYVPLQIVPLPYSNTYNLSMITRNAQAMIRPQGVYKIVIDYTNTPTTW
jgi:hypothetical protein